MIPPSAGFARFVSPRLKPGVILLGLGLTLLAPRAGAQAPPGPSVRPAGPTLDLLRKAHETFARYPGVAGNRPASDALSDTIYAALRKAAPSLPELPLNAGTPSRFLSLTLNDGKAGCDAFRVKVPSLGREYLLTLDLVVPGLVEADSPLRDQGFLRLDAGGYLGRSHLESAPVVDPHVDFPASRLHYVLNLGPGMRIAAGSELILWFDFKGDAPCPAWLSLRADRIESVEPDAPPAAPALQTARATFQAGLGRLSERYDAEMKALRRLYLTEIDKIAQLPATKRDQPEADRIIAELDRVNGGDSATASPRGFRIVRAEYGEGSRWMDVTIPLRSLIRGNTLVYEPSDMAKYAFKPDPSFGTLKHLLIVYTVDGVPAVLMAPDDRRVELPRRTGPKR